MIQIKKMKKKEFFIFGEMEQAQGASTTGNTKTCVAKSERKRRGHFVTFWHQDYPKELPKNAKYLCTCEDTTKEGRWHGHAFIYFKNETTLTGVKKLFGKDAHSEMPHKNSDCIKYVLNTEKRKFNFHEYGERPMDNGVHRMEDVLELNSVTEVMETMPDTYVHFRKGIIDLMENKKSKNRYFKPPKVIWIFGPTGTGKTREAFEAGAVNVTYNNGFFSDWGDARVICIEELRGEIPYKELLKILDGYHNYYSVNIKGGSKFIDLDAIYITSPLNPREAYPRQNEKTDSIDQLLRRITELKCTNIDLTAAAD